jgi:micrococcal nuclease
VVARVIDGDTIEVGLEGTLVEVRLIGVDAPESVHPTEPIECLGRAASAFTRRSLEGEGVGLEFDAERTDRYGRMLAYVWEEGRLFNATLVARGLARVYTFPPNVGHERRFLAAQRRARASDRGLWGGCDGAGKAPPGGGGAGSRRGRCDPDYEGACIPPYPPDLDCSEVSASGFRSVGRDPHGFDGDGDGVGCE